MSNSSPLLSEEKKDITLAKGLGIALVVLGHIVTGSRPQGNEWFISLQEMISLFHMAFFMYLSGFVFFRPGRVQGIASKFPTYFIKQSLRFLVPFMLVGIAILYAKIILSPYMYVDGVPIDHVKSLLNVVWDTNAGPAKFIWYVFVIYIYSLIVPLLFPVFKERMLPWIIIGSILYFSVPSVSYLYVGRMAHFFIFFAVGGFLRHIENRYMKTLDSFGLFWGMLFIASFSLFYIFNLPLRLCALFIGIASMPALHSLCRYLLRRGGVGSALFYSLGAACYIIYLLNTSFIGLAKAIVFGFSSWDGLNFYWVAPLLFIVGLVGPWGLNFILLQKIPNAQKTMKMGKWSNG